jgi:hypothetical protein
MFALSQGDCPTGVGADDSGEGRKMTKPTIYCDRCGRPMPDPPTNQLDIEREEMVIRDQAFKKWAWRVTVVIEGPGPGNDWEVKKDFCHSCTYMIAMRAMEEKTRRFQ